jgi:hypothetical protein
MGLEGQPELTQIKKKLKQLCFDKKINKNNQ